MTLLVITWLAAAPPAPVVAPAPATESSTVALTPARFLAVFTRVDPEVVLAELAVNQAHSALAESLDRQTLDVVARLPVGAGYARQPRGAGQEVTGSFGTISGAEAGLQYGDGWGGQAELGAYTGLTTRPNVAGAQTGGVRAGYRLPLLRNRFGRLFRAAQAARRAALAGAEATAALRRLGQCTSGLDLFLRLWTAQEGARVWQDLLADQERLYRRTARDHRRRLVTKLDYLAAASEWLRTQQRFALFQEEQKQLGAQAATYLGHAPEVLAMPAEVAWPWPDAAASEAVLATHPEVQVWRMARRRALADAQRTLGQYGPELAVGPEFRYDYQGVPGSGASAAGAAALLGLEFRYPWLAPERPRVAERFRLEARAHGRRIRETIRRLRAEAAQAEVVRRQVEARLRLTQEKLRLTEAQIREARRMYGQGRLEFQDYFQHFARYEEARFERLTLNLARWQAQLDRALAQGVLATVCRQVLGAPPAASPASEEAS